MKKTTLIIGTLLCMSTFNAISQNYKDTFDSNSLEWTECAYESNNGSAIIDKGVLTIKSKGENKAMGAALTALSGVNTKVGQNTFFETHCYAPLNVQQPFKVRTKVNIGKLAQDRIAGLVFNYRDGGNFYCFTFNDEMVRFCRYEDYRIVGGIEQGVKWADKKKADHEWELMSDGNILTFTVNGLPILKVKYMPLEYTGIGFYTFGKQELIVDEMEFIQM